MYLLAAPVLLLAILALGLWLCERLRLTPDDPLEHGWVAGVLGLLLMGTVVTALGFLQLLSPSWCWALTLGSLALGVRDLRWYFQRSLWNATCAEWRSIGWPWALLTVALALWLLLYGFLSLAPNTQWDALAHHYLVPWMYLKWGGIYDLQQVQMSYFPSLLQMLYAVGMATGGEQAASLLAWGWSTWLLVGVLVIARRWWGLPAGIAAAALMLTHELYSKQLQGGWADSGVALFILLGAYAPLRWRESGDRRWLWAGGLALGGALAASKHNALLPLALILAGTVLLAPLPRSGGEEVPRWSLLNQLRHGVPAALLLLGLALLPPLCWYLRAWWLTGSPVYPLTMWGLFPGPELPVYAESSWIDRSFRRNGFSLLLYPFTLTYSPALPAGFQGRFYPQWPLLLPWLWIMRWRDVPVRWFTALLILTLGAMFLLAPLETRYMLFAVPWLAILGGGGALLLLEQFRSPAVRSVAVLLLLLIPLGMRQKEWQEDLRQKSKVILKQEPRGKYIARATPLTARIAWMNEHLPEDAFVFVLEDRMYRLERDWTNYYAATEPFPQTAIESYTFCFRQGVTHLFLGDGTIIHAQILKNMVDLPTDPAGYKRFRLAQVMFNLKGELIHRERHWVVWTGVRRMLQRSGLTLTRDEYGLEQFEVPASYLLSTPAQQAHYNVMGAIQEMYEKGWMKLILSDGLNMVFEFDYRAIPLYEDPGKFGSGRPEWTYRQQGVLRSPRDD